MSHKFFHSVIKGNIIGDGTVGDLIEWLEQYVNVLFPDNGIEYFSDNQYAGPTALKRFDHVPSAGCQESDVHHVACYVRQGNCEGRIIEIGLYLRNDCLRSLTWMKSFGKDDECWAIARAIDAALNSIIFYQEIPEIVSMAEKLPKQQKWMRETSLSEEVTVAVTPDSISVTTEGGMVLDLRSWAEEGANARFHIEPRALDWQTVLTNMKARFRLAKENRIVLPDCPGYVISDRGIEGCNGYYVLPPGGNPLDDRDYLGYFYMESNAVTAARLHRDHRQAELRCLLARLDGPASATEAKAA